MTQVLLITSSLNGSNSHSTALAERYIDSLRETNPDLDITRRDLAQDAPAHLDVSTFQAFVTPDEERTDEQRERVRWSDAAIAELKAADLVVLTAPMYNFGVPSTLKSWMDHVARAGITFRYTETGPEGLLTGTRAVVVSTRGGAYVGTPLDTQTPFLKTFLGFLGITEVEFVHAEGLAMGEEQSSKALENARQSLQRLAA
jgi:FMN-dependent NADH-azoreductase